MIGALPPANSHALGRVCGLVWGPMDAPSNGSSMGEIECQLLLGYFLNKPMFQILPALGIFQLPVGDENFDLENLRGFEPGR